VDNLDSLQEDALFGQETYQIIGAAMAVHRALGHGFLEAVYQEALALEFIEKKIPFVKEQALEIQYKGKSLRKKYYADFLCYDQIIIELKAMEGIHNDHLTQVLNYLKATNLKLGLLLNFGTPSLQYKRIIL
jgi:GxxExxY protein